MKKKVANPAPKPVAASTDKFVVRLDPGQLERLRTLAATHRRSMNTMFVLYLEQGLTADEAAQ